MSRSRSIGIVCGVGVLLLALVGWAEEGGDAAKRRADVPLSIPDESHAMKNPIEADAESLDGGKILFDSQCAMCHDPSGNGKGELAIRLKMKIPNFATAKWQKSRTDGDLFYIISEGHGRMRGQKDRLLPKYKWNMINYMRTLDAP